MAFTHVQSVSNGDNGGSSTASSGTLSSAPSSGDLVVFYVNRNDSINISLPTGGSTWTELDQQTPPTGETASHAVFWKIAGASEPTSYSAALNATDTYHTILRVFSSSSDAAVDVWSHSVTTTSVSDIICDAIDGDVISDDAVSIVFGGKDRSASGGNFNSATPTDYIGELGSFEGRFTASAYKIYTTGTTFSGSVDISSAGSPTPDKTYNYHVAFVESASGTTVNANAEALTITENSATVVHNVDVGASTEAITLTENQATVSVEIAVQANTESLVITENSATIYSDVDVGASTESLTITEHAATVSTDGDSVVNASTEALTLTGQQASIQHDIDVVANTEALSITENQATVSLGTNVLSSTEQLTITENTASISSDVGVGANAEALSLTTNSATVTSTGATTLTPQDITNIVDAIFARVIENGETFAQQMKLIRAEAAGKLSVSGDTVSIRDAADSKDRIVATVDSNGQRTSITTDAD